ncbi:MAG TPA: cupin domain-containing protein [Gaiellaceae bacterium]|nr:cupin domain-containing protein [Gaiellaceae bacterium]
MTLAHWDDLQPGRPGRAGLGGAWTQLGTPAGSKTVGLNRIQLRAGEVSTPAHVHGADEEIFFVLAGSGLSWQDGETYEVRAGDCLVHAPLGKAHTLRGGDEGLDVLAYGTRTRIGGAYLPTLGTYWLWPSWAEAGQGANPFDRDPNLEWSEPSPRPGSIVNLDDVEGDYGGSWKRLGLAAGAARSGLNWGHLPPHEEGAVPHCHSAEEEVFVILDGEGTLELWDGPQPGLPHRTEPSETRPIRRGHVIARPAGTRVSHCLRSGDSTLTYLAYGTREPNDICYYPRSNKVFFRGLGLIARLEPLEYSDGEPS